MGRFYAGPATCRPPVVAAHAGSASAACAAGAGCIMAASPPETDDMRLPVLPVAALLAILALAACATTPGPDETPPVDLAGAEVATRTLENGDIVQEYRVGTQLRMVRITPPRGPAYYLYDRDGDGRLDRNDAERLPQTYWKLFSW